MALRTIRAAQQITNENLAREAGVTLRTVQRWQLGESEPKGTQLLRLAEALDVAPDEFYVELESAA